MLLGLLLAVAIVCSNVSVGSSSLASLEQTTTANDSGEKEVVTLSASQASTLPSTFHVHFNMDAYCLFEVSGSTEKDEDIFAELKLPTPKLLFKLFRVIISPNAP